MFNKKGVSLVTVLLFMLVATIAATATFKWLTSENRSSASRMQIQEAKQSAAAGIQSTRAWLTNKANDVGAVVQQYSQNGNKILLDSLVNPFKDSKQEFHVWLTGVTEVNGTFKFKILSEGISRNKSKYTEAAILNVSGLYQVPPPTNLVKNISYDYSYFGSSISNHGSANVSSMLINGNWYGNPVEIKRNIVITGNAKLSGSDVQIKGTACIGGDLHGDNGVDAHNILVGGNAYNFGTEPERPGVSNHAYFMGEVQQQKKFFVKGNMTAKGKIRTTMLTSDASVTVKGNLCLDSTASQVQIGDLQNKPLNAAADWTPTLLGAFTVEGDVWAKYPYAFYIKGGESSGLYDKIILGSNDYSNVYAPDAYPSSDYVTMRNSKSYTGSSWWSDYKPYVEVAAADNKYYFYVAPTVTDVSFDGNDFYVGGYKYPHHFQYGTGYTKKLSPYCNSDDNYYGLPKLHVTPWFKSMGTVTRDQPSTPPACADSVFRVCDEIWEKKPGCDGANYKVEDILKHANIDTLTRYATRGCAANISGTGAIPNTIDDSETNDFSVKLNDCYAENIGDVTKKQNNLYNGYLVVRMQYGNLKQNFRQKLKGHFVIILTNKPNETIVLPATDGDADSDNFVFLYLAKGGGQIQGLNKGYNYNYFIYTKENVGSSSYNTTTHEIVDLQGGFLFNDDYFNGSVYAEVGSGTPAKCAKVSALTSKLPMVFNHKLLNSLTQSKVICDVSVPNCGGTAPTSSSSAAPTSSSTTGSTNADVEPYISIAPRLNVTLETQYKADEQPPSGNNVSEIDPSILVLPRIIYLSMDAPGKLSDYYSVLTLNRKKSDPAPEQKNSDNVSCNTTFNSPLYGGAGQELTPGNYKCAYTSANFGVDSFYVVVNSTTGEVPIIEFNDPYTQTLSLDETRTLSVHIGRGTKPIKFDVTLDKDYSGWEITPKPGVTERNREGTESRRFTVEITPNASSEQDIDILEISTGHNAEDGDQYYTLSIPTENCTLGEGEKLSSHVIVRARTNITRASIETFCENNPPCSEDLIEKSERPDCDFYEEEWIKASGTGCYVDLQNRSWKCLTNTPISLVSVNTSSVPQECEIIIPSGDNNKVSQPVSGETNILYASLKRKKVDVIVSLRNTLDKYTNVRVREENFSFDEICKKEDAPCTFNVLAGTPIVFTHQEFGQDENNFNYWKCAGDDCPNPTSNHDTVTYTFYGPDSVTAVFNRESHCYYDDFTSTTAFCATNDSNCVDTCATALTGSQACQPKFSMQPRAHWLMTYHNKNVGSNYIRPNFGTNSIYASVAQDKPSIILRNKTLGMYGSMFSLVQTGVVEKNNSKDLLNSGLIFRSNGEEHLILNIYGISGAGNSGELAFRVCKVEGQSISSTTEGHCIQVPKSEGIHAISITNSTFIKARLTIDENDLLKVAAKVNDDTWEGEVNVGSLGCNSNAYTYVGFSLADPDFRIYDNGWVSSGLDETCWDVPTVTCEFSDKYEGKVPYNEYVSPYVSPSTWFSDKNCTTEYYYNGCDNETSDKVNCSGSEAIGQPGEIGSKLSGDQYRFTQTGLHGYTYEDKLTQEASIKMVCPGDAGSLDLAKDYYSCGQFKVGDFVDCSSDMEIYDDEKSMIADTPYEFVIPNADESLNMFGAELHINIDKAQANNATIKVQLQSTNGIKSLTRTMSEPKVSVDYFATTTIGFDPQKVSKVIITSDKDINVPKLHIHSKCPNLPELKCDEITANYEYLSKGWKIHVNEQARKADITCSYTASGLKPETSDGCKDIILQYNENGSYNWLFDDPPIFTVTATKKKNTKTCTVQGTRTGNNQATCYDITPDTIPLGSTAPDFRFRFGESSPWGFATSYQLTLDGEKVKDGQANYGVDQKYESTSKPTSGKHTYKVVFNFGYWTPSCEKDFYVKDTTSLVKGCSVDGQGKFTANINNVDDGEFQYTFGVTDAQGNVLASETNSSNLSNITFPAYTPSLGGTYIYTISVTKGDKTGSCTEQFNYSANLTVTCPANVTDQDPNSTISVQASATPCGSGCTYEIDGKETSWDDPYVLFSDASAAIGKDTTVTYTLNITSPYGKSKSCTFTVAFKDTTSNQQQGAENEIAVYCLYDFNNSLTQMPKGTVNLTCWDGQTTAKAIRCCSYPDCYNGKSANWKINGNLRTNPEVRTYNDPYPCSNGETVKIESEGDIQCGVANY